MGANKRFRDERIDFDCPVQRSQRALQGLSLDMADRIHQLRCELELCPTCPLVEGCLTLAELNQVVHAAVDDVTEAWNLTRLVTPPEMDDWDELGSFMPGGAAPRPPDSQETGGPDG
jgi:hypothetical protein